MGKIINIFTIAILSACIVIFYLNLKDAAKERRGLDAAGLIIERNILNQYPRSLDWNIPCHVQVAELIEVIDDISQNKNLRKGAAETLNHLKQELIQFKDSVGMEAMTKEQHQQIKTFVQIAGDILDSETKHLINDPYNFLIIKHAMADKE